MTRKRQVGFVEWMGLEEEDLGPGKVACRLQTDERHQNILGVVHGLIATALMDTAMGHAVTSLLGPGEFCGTTQLSLQYLRAAHPGERLDAVGQVTRKGRRVAHVEGVCHNAAGELVARAHGTWHIGKLRTADPDRADA